MSDTPPNQAPGTQAPTTQAPTTQAPGSQAPGTQGPGVGPAQAPAGFDWKSAGLDADQLGWVSAKGYQGVPDLVKAAHSLETTIGSDRLALPPKDAQGNRDWSKWDGWSHLGVPEAPDKYALDPDTKADAETLKWFQGVAHQHKIPQAAFKGLVGAWNARVAELVQAHDAEVASRAASTDQALRAKWGTAYDAKMQKIANVVPKDIAEMVLGAAKSDLRAMEWLDKIAEHFGEDGAPIDGGGGGAPMSLTPDDAKREIDKIRYEAGKDPKHPYNDAAHPEHDALIKKLQGLYAMAYPERRA